MQENVKRFAFHLNLEGNASESKSVSMPQGREGRHCQQPPLSILVEDGYIGFSRLVNNIHCWVVVGPGTKYKRAGLVIQGKVWDFKQAGGLVDARTEPLDITIWEHRSREVFAVVPSIVFNPANVSFCSQRAKEEKERHSSTSLAPGGSLHCWGFCQALSGDKDGRLDTEDKEPESSDLQGLATLECPLFPFLRCLLQSISYTCIPCRYKKLRHYCITRLTTLYLRHYT